MILVRETSPGVFEPVFDNVLLSLDGTEQAPLPVLMHESWTDADRARFGVIRAEPAVVPEGKRAVGAPTYQKVKGKVVQVFAIEDVPPPPDHSKVEAALAGIGLTLDELRAALVVAP